jgi:DNA-binding response OmpR family regulator
MAQKKGSGDQLERKVVLVVGTDESVAGTVRDVLPNWRIQQVDKNNVALELLRQRSYDLVLTDNETTGEQDVELLRQIRKSALSVHIHD